LVIIEGEIFLEKKTESHRNNEGKNRRNKIMNVTNICKKIEAS
jgi:hypothetical protein